MKRDQGVCGRARRQRWTAAFISASVAPIVAPLVGSVLSNAARAETKVFSTTGTDWSVPANWSPAGVPTASDGAFITGGSADITLTGTTASVLSLTFDSQTNRLLGNATTGSADSTLTLVGGGTSPALSVASGTFTIQGANDDPTGTGTGRLALSISNNQQWSTSAGASLVVSSDIGETGKGLSLSFIGDGTVTLSGNNTYTGGTTVDACKVVNKGTIKGNITIQNAGRFSVDVTNPPPGGQLDANATIELDGGTFSLEGTAGPGGGVVVVGLMKAKEKANQVKCGNLRPLSSSLERDPGATLNVQMDAGGQLTFTTPPPMTNGIVGGWATGDFAIFSGTTWEKVDNSGSVVPFTAFDTSSDPNTWTAASNARYLLRAGVPLKFDTTVNSLKIDGDPSGPSTLTVDARLTVASGGILATTQSGHVITGAGSLTSGGSELFIHVPDPTHTFTVGVPIADGSVPVSLVKAGDGALVLNADNTLTGDVNVNGGSVILDQFGTLIDSTVNILDDRNLLGLRHYNKTVGGLSGSGTVDLNGVDLAVGHNGRSTSFGGEILAAGGSLTKVGSGELALTAINLYTGDTTVGEGTLTLSGSGALSNTRSIRIRGGSTSTRGGSMRLLGEDFITITPDRINDSAVIEMGGGAFELDPGALAYTENVGVLKLTTGSNTIKIGTTTPSNSGTIRYTGTDFEGRSAGATLDFQFDAGGSVYFTSPPALTNGIIGPYATVNGADWASIDGAGRVYPLPGYWTSADPATWDDTKNVQPPTSVTVSASTDVNTLKLSNGISITLTGNNFFSTGGIIALGNTSIAGSGSVAGKRFGIGDTAPGCPLGIVVSDTLAVSAAIVDNPTQGATELVKSGPGTSILGGALSYTGDTYINQGTLQLAGSADLSNSYVHKQDDGVFVYTGPSDKHLGGLDGGGTLQFGTGTLSIGASNRSGLYSGTITSSGGSLEKDGTGTLELIGSGDLGGGELRINGGRIRTIDLESVLKNIGLLRLGGPTTSGTLELTGDDEAIDNQVIHVPIAVGDGNGRINKVRVVYSRQIDVTMLGAISGAGSFTDSGGSSNYLVSNPLTGSLTVSGAEATLSGAGAFPSVSDVSIDSGGSLSIDTSSGVIDRINDSASIELSGGTLSLVGTAGPGGGIEVVGLMKAKEKANRTKCANNLRIIASGLEHDPGATLDVQLDAGSQLSFTSPPALTNGILGEWATVNGSDWATINAATGELVPYAAYTTGLPLVWSPKSNVSIDSSVSITSNTDVNTMRLASAPGTPGSAAIAAGVLFRTSGILDTGSNDSITGGGLLSATPGGSKNIGVYVSDVSGNFTVAVPIVDNSEGSIGLIKSGDGTLVLNAHNTYTGPTEVQRGTLKTFFETGDIPTQDQMVIDTAGTLDLNGNTLTLGSLSGGGTLLLGNSGGGGGGGGGAGGGALGTLTIDQATDSVFHVMNGDGNVIKRGAGSLTLDGQSLFTGTLDVSGGSLVLEDGASLDNTSGVTLRATASLTIKEAQTAREQLEKNPRNRTAPVNPVAPITLDGGDLEVKFGAGLGRTDLAGVQDFGGLIVADGGNTVGLSVDLDTTASIQFSSLTRTGGGNINWNFQGGGSLLIRNAPPLTNGIIGPWATVGGSDWATVTSDGQLVAYTGYRVNPDPPTWTAADNVSMNIPAVLNGNVVVGSMKIDSVRMTINGSSFCSTAGILATGSGGGISGSGSLSAIKAPAGATVLLVNVAQDFSISTRITDSSGVTVGLTKTGDGILSLAGTCTYTGDTTINQGTLELLSLQPLGGNIIIHGGSALRLGGGVTIPVASNITLADANPSIDVQPGQLAHIRGGIMTKGDDVGFTKTGGGTLALDADNSYGGPTTVAGGTLQVASGHSLGNGGSNNSLTLQTGGTIQLIGVWGSTNKGSRLIAAGGTFDTNGFDADLGDVTGGGDFTKQGAGAFNVITCQCNHLRVAGGTLVTKSDVGLGSVPNASRINSMTIDPGAKLDLTAGKLITQDPVGIITITGNNYTGVTGIIQAGRNGNAQPLWDGSGIVTSQSAATTSNYTSIGVAAASDVRPMTATATALWGGQTISGTDTLVMYTYGGDANLDGKINIDDYIRIDNGIASGLTGWSNGDFNYDGKVNIDDYTQFIDANISTQGAQFSTARGIGDGGSLGVSAVPEPAGIGMLIGASALVMRRKRRSNR